MTEFGGGEWWREIWRQGSLTLREEFKFYNLDVSNEWGAFRFPG
jgi:hypothetical protein